MRDVSWIQSDSRFKVTYASCHRVELLRAVQPQEEGAIRHNAHDEMGAYTWDVHWR